QASARAGPDSRYARNRHQDRMFRRSCRYSANRVVGAHIGMALPEGSAISENNVRATHFIVGMTKEEPSFTPPLGQREVTVLMRVQNFTPSGPCWFVSPSAGRF